MASNSFVIITETRNERINLLKDNNNNKILDITKLYKHNTQGSTKTKNFVVNNKNIPVIPFVRQKFQQNNIHVTICSL